MDCHINISLSYTTLVSNICNPYHSIQFYRLGLTFLLYLHVTSFDEQRWSIWWIHTNWPGEKTSREHLQNFCQCVCEVYSSEYLRKPNSNDVQNELHKHSGIHGFPCKLESIDCIHWPWKNYHVACKGQYTRGDKECPTIMLEAVASHARPLDITCILFGVVGSSNDINVLDHSPLFNDVLQGHDPECCFSVNGKKKYKEVLSCIWYISRMGYNGEKLFTTRWLKKCQVQRKIRGCKSQRAFGSYNLVGQLYDV